MLHRIKPEEVRVGMYVVGFGGSWFDQPLWRSRLLVRTADELDRIACSRAPYVVIDDARGAKPTASQHASAEPSFSPPRIRPAGGQNRSPRGRGEDVQAQHRRSERQHAQALVARSMTVMRNAFADVRLGRAVRMAEVTALVDDVVVTVERSPRTLLDVLRLKKKDEYTYMHSVAVCTLMINVARHMGKGEAETRDFGLAGLLHDLGKIGVPDAILNKSGKLTDEEYLAVKDHPERGYQMLMQASNVPETALDVCRHHHEKIDGTGYPFGLSADDISLVARVGAICDVYDALTSERVYKDAWSPIEALEAMWSWEGHFDRQFLFTFMQSIGVFPPGMLVQLRSNRLALVLENKRRNSRPRVLAFYDTRERALIPCEEIVIQDNLANDSIVAPAQPEDWGIKGWDRLAERLLSGDRERRRAA